MLIVDGHLDLANNALRGERDQRLAVAALRERERGADESRGICTVTLPELRRGGVAVVVSTLLARCKPWLDPARSIKRTSIDYVDETMSFAAAQGELAYYRLLQQQGELRVLESARQLDEHVERWSGGATKQVGVILTMEGADPIVEPEQVRTWHAQGLRTLMLAHFGRSRFAAGTPSTDPDEAHDVDGPLTGLGYALLKEMEQLEMPLDLSHSSDQSFFCAIDAFGGTVYSSHATCRALVAENWGVHPMRLHTDEQLRLLVRREGVIGVTMFNAHLQEGYKPPPESDPDSVTLQTVGVHVDHICQLAGSARHVAIGSDLDGGFGCEHTPRGLDTIADLARIGPVLSDRGFSDEDIGRFLGGNWLAFWRGNLPDR
ncbi:MAG: peptidase [Phycisphaeraceae bacterium]|nr:peptidase [Phycisphaeraceae bacterium]